ncbi:MAG: cysteine--tRNA ligase [Pseudomonadaceae bacterium]|nr:cysteine--tRNA ligase [Pseudomonadaceae bacterium]
MKLSLYNTANRQKELFTPIDPNRVTMYVCGPTVYNYVHIGNGRPAVVFDVLFRLLRSEYPEVLYARNVTDIDDKINAAAMANGEPIKDLADRFTDAYNADIQSLGVLEATVVPRATHHITEIVDMIEALIERGHAYAADGHVLFSVPSDAHYGELSRRTIEELLEGARVDVAPYKRDAKDFVLWKPSPDDLPGWDSPWGYGRPGWHIECSAMIKKHLGEHIDIHGGGSDLVFPHHENELAQSTCANDSRDYVNYWVHNGMLTLGQEKMSKSVGNVVTIHELREQYDGEVLRYALLSGQYRSPLAWSAELLQQAQTSLERLYQALRNAGNTGKTAADFADKTFTDFPGGVTDALCDDLNSPVALSALHELAGRINRSELESEKLNLAEQLLAGGWLLGLLNHNVETYFSGSEATDGLSDEAINRLIQARDDAKANRDFSGADAIRAELLDAGIVLEDTREGTRWRRER